MNGGRPRPFHQHDLLVVLAGLALLAGGSLAYNSLTAPTLRTYSRLGLELRMPGNWLPSESVAPAPPRLMSGVEHGAAVDTEVTEFPFHELYSSTDAPDLRLEIRIDAQPAYGNLRAVLSFERRNRYGELYKQLSGHTTNIQGHDWLRTRFRYAYKLRKNHAPRTAVGVEFATISDDRLYVITLHGDERGTKWLSDIVGSSLRVPGDPAAEQLSPLLSSGSRIHRDIVKRSLPSVVLVMAVDLVGDRLVPVSGGSGAIVARDGSVLTNFHVINDESKNRLHDLFVIGRFRAEGSEPDYVCAGRPNHSKVVPKQDLALIKCDLDMNGQSWTPDGWPAIPIELSTTVVRGEQIWVLGYPAVGGGAIAASTGEITGTLRDSDDGETSMLVSTASISFGSSGGAAIDDAGMLIGVPTAFRARARIEGNTITRLGDEGLIRPLQRASSLLAVAQSGWVPTLGDNMVMDSGSGPLDIAALENDVLHDQGVHVSSTVRDAANDNPIADAVVIVFQPGITSSDVDMNRLHETTLTWGRTDGDGHFTLQRLVPRGSRYTVAIMAKGYQPLVQTDVLSLETGAPSRYDPWGVIYLER